MNDRMPSTGLLFPLTIKKLMQCLESVGRWYLLGIQLDLPTHKLDEIANSSHDVAHCRMLMLQEWQKRLDLKPSWHSLVEALRNIDENVIAGKLSKEFCEFPFELEGCSLM